MKSSSLPAQDIDEGTYKCEIAQTVHQLAAKDIVERSAGTVNLQIDNAQTQVQAIPKTSLFSYFSDGSFVRAPQPITIREWKAMPTSSGKSFEWEGVVVAVGVDAFEVRLHNVRGAPNDFDEITEFEIADVPPGDRDLLKPGGIFRWVVGFESQSGTRKKYSRIVFRRLPALTPKSLEASASALGKTISGIEWI